jgi:hypothetical protein
VVQLRQVIDPDDDRGLPQAAAVDWIEITPLTANRAAGNVAGSAPPPDAGRR